MTSREHLVGGFAGGVVSTLTCHPLDLLRIRYSANEGNNKLRPQYRSYWHATRTIIAAEGYRGLYQGLSPNLVGASLAWGLYFDFYYIIKAKCNEHRITSGNEMVDNFFIGLTSGASVLALTNPIWVAKTRLCLQYENQLGKRYTGMIHCIRRMAVEEGFSALYKGFVPGLLGTGHGALQFMLYNYLKDSHYRKLGVTSDYKLSTIDYLLYSSASKIVATTLTFPYQLLRTRLQDQHADYRGVWDVCKRTFQKEGIFGFYKGLYMANIRQVPAAVVTFITYENVRHLFRTYSLV
ncbi:unnamed protein product [Anisakis simplex]|uniref:Mitochondrial folate transporter/carrier (inferred by orthology to a human protein) n=1 Tax=Anisakis simplex TaxID=6269 RepID=A0A0M3K620_ANISI|nr:unnamed protein product [Anisakis simplex]